MCVCVCGVCVCVCVVGVCGVCVCVCGCVHESYSEGTYAQLLVFEGFVMVCVGSLVLRVFPEFDGSCLDV